MKWIVTETVIGDASEYEPLTKEMALKDLKEILKAEGKNPTSVSIDDIIIKRIYQ